MIQRDDVDLPPMRRCAICNAQSLGVTWGFEMCPSCSGEWFADPRFEAGEVDRASGGVTHVPGIGWLTADGKLPDGRAEYERRTKAWVAEKRSSRVTDPRQTLPSTAATVPPRRERRPPAPPLPEPH